MEVDGWRSRKVRDFAVRAKVINVDGTILPPLSITKARGVVLQSEKYKKQIATDLRKYIIARRDQFAFDPMSLYYGAIGRVASIEIGLVSPDYVVFDVDDTVDKQFLSYLLRSPKQVATYETVAETGNQFGKRRRVYWSVFEELTLTLPPIEEQRKIAAILSSMDDAIEATQAVIGQLRLTKRATMDELLTRGIPGRHARYKQTDIGSIPEEWEVRRIGELFDMQLGKMLNEAAKGKDDKLPYLANRNVQWGRVRLDVLNTMMFSPEEQRKFSLVPGDLLVCEGGEVGRTAIWRGELGRCFFQKAVHRLRPRKADIAPEYFLYYMQKASADGLFERLTGKSSIAHLTKEKLATAQVAVPRIDEQVVIANTISVIDERLLAEAKTLEQSQRMLAAMTASFLAGEVRVTQKQDAA